MFVSYMASINPVAYPSNREDAASQNIDCVYVTLTLHFGKTTG